MGLRCSWGTARAGRRPAWRRSSTGLRARGVDADGHRPAQAQGRGRGPGVPPRRPERAATSSVGGHSYGGRVASLAAAEPDAPYAGARPVQLPAPSARQPGADRGPDRPLAGDPLPGPAAVGRVGPVRPDRAAAGGRRGCSPTPSWSPTRGSATRSSRSSTTPSTASRRSCERSPAARRGSSPWPDGSYPDRSPGAARRRRRSVHSTSLSPSECPAAAPSCAVPGSADRADVRRAHRVVPVGRSCIASPEPAAVARSSSPSSSATLIAGPGRPGRSTRPRHRPASSASCTPSARSSPAGATPPGTRHSGAYGKYQIMPSNWPAWAGRYLGNANAQADAGQPGEGRRGQVHGAVPLARELAAGRLLVADRLQAHDRLVVVRDALREPGHAPVQARPAAARRGREPRRRRPKRFSEQRARAIDYSGSLETRQARRLRRRRGPLRDQGRRDGDAHVHRPADPLVRPGRPDPRQGPGLVDGNVVRTVDLHRGGVRGPGRRSSSTAGRPAGTHTLTIEVVGTPGHPMVAIDEFVVIPER